MTRPRFATSADRANYNSSMSTVSNPSSSPPDFYARALTDSFRHSGLLAPLTGRRAADVLHQPEFDAILAQAAPWSLEAARRIGDLATVHLNQAAAPWPWWKDLLAYERAWFLQAASTDQRLVTYLPRRGVAATTENFSWDMPRLLERIAAHAAEQTTGLQDVPRRALTLLFSRKDAQIYVIELEKPVAAVFRFTNGMRKPEQIAATAALPPAEVADILGALAEIGAVENI